MKVQCGPEACCPAGPIEKTRSRMHLVDTTLFYSPTSGGVKRYLAAKHDWLRAHSSWTHSIVVPGDVERVERGSVCTVAGYPVPGTFNYRLPLNPRRWSELLASLEARPHRSRRRVPSRPGAHGALRSGAAYLWRRSIIRICRRSSDAGWAA